MQERECFLNTLLFKVKMTSPISSTIPAKTVDISKSISQFFPHETIRKGQDELTEDIEKAFSKNKILLAHAPTGLGKTASALSVALRHALEHKKTVFFLTNRHTQHQIAIETLKLIKQKTKVEFTCVDLIGKKWMCNQEIAGLFGNEFNEFCKTMVEKGECEFYNNVKQKKKITVEGKLLLDELKRKGIHHNEEIIHLCGERRMCSYEISIELAKKAKVFIGDYYYLFNPFVQNTLFNKLSIELENVILIVDEGHNLPNRITEMLSSNLTSNMLKNAIMEAKKFGYRGVIFWLQEVMRVLNEMAEFPENSFGKEKLVQRDDFVSEVKKVVDYEEFTNELELAADEIRKKQRKSYLGGVSSFLESWLGEDEGFVRIISEQQGKLGPVTLLRYSCLDPGIITKDVFSQIHCGLIMSGTLKPTSMYKDVLAIENGIEKEYISPFPPKNKLSLIVPETTTKYSLRGEAMYKRIAEKCSELSSLIPGNVALFFPSYDLRDRVGMFFQSEKKLFWEKSLMSKEEKENFISDFKLEQEKGGVLLGVTGANFAEGIDFPGDLLKGVVVIGLPLGKPNLKTKEVIKYYESKFGRGWDYGYIFPAISKCIQSAGRCIRSETDKGAIVFLDERFAWQNYYGCLPREGLIVSKDYAKMLKEFWGATIRA